MCMKVYVETQTLYLQMDASGINLELPSYKPEAVQAAQQTKHQTTVYSDPLHLIARTCQVQKEDTAILKERD